MAKIWTLMHQEGEPEVDDSDEDDAIDEAAGGDQPTPATPNKSGDDELSALTTDKEGSD
jgi:hypothetical protein